MSWEQLYDLLGIREFIYFISSPIIQEKLFAVKLVFIFFALFFLVAVIYFYINSTYLQYQFLQDAVEFFSWQPYGLRGINKRWKSIMKKTETGNESDYKLAVIEADDFLYQVLEERGYEGETFEELVNQAGKKALPNISDILRAHETRNLVVYNQDYNLSRDLAVKILADYEISIKNIAVS